MDETPQLGQPLELDEGGVLFPSALQGVGFGVCSCLLEGLWDFMGFGVSDFGRGLGFVMIAWESKLGVQDL